MSRYLKIDLKNLDPLRIADDRTSQHGQTDTLRYIPGSALRGYVMSELAKRAADFETWKPAFFNGKIRFLNAYLTVDGKEMIPSLKGFYEDKTPCVNEKDIENVLVKEDVTSGYKRASLGSYCYVDGIRINYTGIELSEDININNGRTVENGRADNRNIYRSQYICKGQDFTGYIMLADDLDPKLVSEIRDLFRKEVRIGNRRSGGYGTCQSSCTEKNGMLPYASVRTQKSGKTFYMILLSHLTMRSGIGEPVGLNLEELAERLGCGKLELVRCATSTAQVYGYNRIWKGTIPSANMYEAGSVFRLQADKVIPEENFRKVEQEGLGIRTAEGFGQVAFMADFGELTKKHPTERKTAGTEKTETPSFAKEHIRDDVCVTARGLLQHRIERGIERYIVEHTNELKGITGSQLGQVASMCISWQYEPETANEKLEKYKTHSEEKGASKKREDGKKTPVQLYKYLTNMLGSDLYDLLGISKAPIMKIPIDKLLSDDEKTRYKLQLMERQIRYANREERNRG